MELHYSLKSLRNSAVLTTSYVAGTVYQEQGLGQNIDPIMNNQLMLYVALTLGSLTSAELKVEFSDDGTNWYQETSSSVSAGTSTDSLVTHTFTASGNYRLPISIADRKIRVSVKGTGTVTNSLMAVLGIVAVRP